MSKTKTFPSNVLSALRDGFRLSTWMPMLHDIAQIPARVHALLIMLTLSMTQHAMAAGLSGFFSGWTQVTKDAGTFAINLGMLLGVFAFLYGAWMMVKKGMSQRDDIEWKSILWPMGGGAFLTVLLYGLQLVVETSGASKSDMGRTL